LICNPSHDFQSKTQGHKMNFNNQVRTKKSKTPSQLLRHLREIDLVTIQTLHVCAVLNGLIFWLPRYPNYQEALDIVVGIWAENFNFYEDLVPWEQLIRIASFCAASHSIFASHCVPPSSTVTDEHHTWTMTARRQVQMEMTEIAHTTVN